MKSLSAVLMFLGVFFIAVCVVLSVALIIFPESSLSMRTRLVLDQTPLVSAPYAEDVNAAFRTTLQNEVRQKLGTPVEGFEPFMYLQVFPGLTETDFEGVEASIGHYTVEDGRLVHKLDTSKLIHSAAKAITDGGMDQLLRNVSERLKVDLSKDGTLTTIMSALSSQKYPNAEELEGAFACTMDAKICPDGSAVGRVGPACAFAPCPQ